GPGHATAVGPNFFIWKVSGNKIAQSLQVPGRKGENGVSHVSDGAFRQATRMAEGGIATGAAGSREELIEVIMRADPEPADGAALSPTSGTDVVIDPHRPDVASADQLLKAKRG
ncbi:MAG: hypothetical protein ABI946_04170, partial [Chthoniobacterales bacterium]